MASELLMFNDRRIDVGVVSTQPFRVDHIWQEK
jgi:hypothetical protein